MNKSAISYNNKRFVAVQNSSNGEVSAAVEFCYYQENNIIWATYQGGNIVRGTLIGKVEHEGSLHFVYQHINSSGQLMTGKCNSIPKILADGRIRLYETWQWTCGDFSAGTSVVEEIVL
jgi:hypothetical protein